MTDVEICEDIIKHFGCSGISCVDCPVDQECDGPECAVECAREYLKHHNKTVTRTEAYRTVLNGVKVSPPSRPESYIYFDENMEEPFRYVKANGHEEAVKCIMQYADGYTIYNQPKEKVKMWQWAYVPSGSKRPRATGTYFKSEEDAANGVKPGKLVQRLDNTMIDVEV